MATSISTPELHRLCGELEKAADAGDWERIVAALPRLASLLEEFETAPG